MRQASTQMAENFRNFARKLSKTWSYHHFEHFQLTKHQISSLLVVSPARFSLFFRVKVFACCLPFTVSQTQIKPLRHKRINDMLQETKHNELENFTNSARGETEVRDDGTRKVVSRHHFWAYSLLGFWKHTYIWFTKTLSLSQHIVLAIFLLLLAQCSF